MNNHDTLGSASFWASSMDANWAEVRGKLDSLVWLFVLLSLIFSSYFLLNVYLLACYLCPQPQMLTERGGLEQTVAVSQCSSPAHNLPCQRTPPLPGQHRPESHGESLPFASMLLAGSFHLPGGRVLSVQAGKPDSSPRPVYDKLWWGHIHFLRLT